MISANLQWVADVLNTQPSADSLSELTTPITEISTDSRTISPGQVFVALQGPNFDGNKFVQQVKEKGAVAAVVTQKQDVDLPQFVVKDTLHALGTLGKAVASEVNAKTIAITGSVGKTSVKEMCAAILSQCGEVLATKGNFNNDIGVPLTLLRLEPKHEFAIVELGANHIGEIAYTTALTQPDVAILNSVAESHLEGFGDIMGVVRAKGEIFNGLTSDGVAIVNGDSEYKGYWLPTLEQKFSTGKGSILQFSVAKLDGVDNNVYAQDIVLNAAGCASFTLCYQQQKQAVKLALPGKHNVANALSAATACMQVGASLEQVASGLAEMATVKGRVNVFQLNKSLTIIDDTYNANVQSVKAAAELLASYDRHSIMVLGDMGELGSDARRYHQEVGEFAKAQGVSEFYSFGVLSQSASDGFGDGGQHFGQKEQLNQALIERLQQINAPVTILVKGSRSAKMEQVVEVIKTQFGDTSFEN